MKKALRILSCVVAISVISALLSFVTTVHSGEDDWPAASLEIRALDGADLPVEGAIFSVFRGNNAVPEFQRAFCFSSNWASNKNGTINLLVKPLRFKVTSFRLFWLFRFTQSDGNFDARLDAPGYKSAIVPFQILLDAASFEGRRPVSDAEAERGFGCDELDIFRATVVLKK